MSVARLRVNLPNPGDYIALGYDVFEWERSEDGETGTYMALTGVAATAAVLTGTDAEPFTLSGKALNVEIKGVLNAVNFTAGDPHTVAAVVAACAALSGATAANDGTGKLKLTTDSTGTGETLQIATGTANTELGFTQGDHAWGLDQYPVLYDTTTTYVYRDQSGSTGFWYRYRLLDLTTGGYTQWSIPFQATDQEVVDSSLLCLCYVDLAKADGTAMSGHEILVANPKSAENVKITGSTYTALGARVTFETDANGHAEINLIRGMIVDFSVEGTGLVRRVTIPNAASVNLLDASLATDDMFEVQEFDVPLATRTI